MSHAGHERTTRDNNLCQSSLPQSLSVSQWSGGEGGDGGNEQEGYFTMQPMGLDSVKLKADKVSSCKKTVFTFLTKGIPF